MMKNNLITFLFAVLLLSFTACVSTRKYTDAKLHIGSLRADSMRLSRSLDQCKVKNTGLNENIDSLNNKLDRFVKAAKSQISDQKGQLGEAEKTINDQKRKIAEQKKRMAEQSDQIAAQQSTMTSQQKRVAELQGILDNQKAITQKLHQSISNALMGFDPDELTVTRKNGKVYVSMQEKLLFSSGSAKVGKKGKEALSKVAEVLNKNKDIQINIEGHTDSIPISGRYQDNWALSLARSASVVRILTNSYHVDPNRVIASGHSKYNPVDTNNTAEGRAHNRRTDIILSPNLDELYKLINQQGGDNQDNETY